MISILDFKTEYVPGKDGVDMVLLAPKGEGHTKTQTWRRVEKLMPPENADDAKKASATYQDMAAKWSLIGPAYQAWKQGNALPETGTPLAAWSGVTADMAKALVAMGIRTVEDVRDMSTEHAAKLAFPNARKLPELAGKFLEGKDLAARDQENAELKERLAKMEEMLQEAMENKPKRGRPRKETEAA